MDWKKQSLIALILTIGVELIILLIGMSITSIHCKPGSPCPTAFELNIPFVYYTFIPLFLIILLILYFIDKFKRGTSKK